jgi:hypothetical protein
MSQPLPHSLRPIWLDLYDAVAKHVDADDHDEFLDTIVTMANLEDTHKGQGAGDTYIARVIRSLTGQPVTGDADTPQTSPSQMPRLAP